MTNTQIQVLCFILLLVMAITGYYCAAKLSHEYPLWVRLIVLYPALASMCTMATMLRGHYVAYMQDIVLQIGIALLYALVASRFSSSPWLDMRVHKEAKETR